MVNNPMFRIHKKLGRFLREESRNSGKSIIQVSENVIDEYNLLKEYAKNKKKWRKDLLFRI
jgi:hypothetical protein